MTITPLDLGDESAARTAYDIRLACHREGAAAEPIPGFGDWLVLNRVNPPHVSRWHWHAPGGYASLNLAAGSPGGVGEVCVAAERRRRGLGRALLATVREQARQAGCSTVVLSYSSEPGAGFSRAVGAGTGRVRRVQILALPVPVPQGGAPDGFTLRSWIGETPAELLDSFADAFNGINDAPGSPGGPVYHMTPRKVRDREASLAGRGMRLLVSVAVDAYGQVAGLTVVRVSGPEDTVGRVEDTVVVAEYRGRGLATAIKAESVRFAMRERPGLTAMITANDTGNEPMLAVNRRLGFEPVSTWTTVTVAV